MRPGLVLWTLISLSLWSKAKNAFLAGFSQAFPSSEMYFEGMALVSDTDQIGAYGVYSLMLHTTYFNNFDLGIGADYAVYSTGDIVTIRPQILYFISDRWMLGHTSWFFDADGNHHAWRNHVRYQDGPWRVEAGISGGSSREDIGIIDDFYAYSLSFRREWGRFRLGFNAERYEATLRSGWMWGISGSWQF